MGPADFCLVIIIYAPHALLCCHIYQAPEVLSPNTSITVPLVLICGQASHFVVLAHSLGLSNPLIQFASKYLGIPSDQFSYQVTDCWEPTQQSVTAGLAIAQCGHILNYCILTLNSLFCTQICDPGAVQLYVISALQPGFARGSVSRECWSQTQGRRHFLPPICVLWASGGSPHPSFFTSGCFCSSS